MTNQAKNFLDIILNRRSIRKFRSDMPDEMQVKKIVKAGQRAPSACNLQTYSIIWVRDEKLKQNVLEA